MTLEHDPRYLDRVRRWLGAEGLTEHVDARLAPLCDTDHGPWYETNLDGQQFDFALIDGPPESTGGRGATLPNLIGHMVMGGGVWLDDGDRPGEQAAIESWMRADLPAGYRSRRIGRGIVEITGYAPRVTPQAASFLAMPDWADASDVVVTILTGQRPQLLARTLGALDDWAPWLLDTAGKVALNNGDDERTAEILQERGIDPWDSPPGIMPIGPATSSLARAAHSAAEYGAEYWLHLEDDWELTTMHPGWLDEARVILDECPDVYQVRLRHITEPTLNRHLHTKKPIDWHPLVSGKPVAPSLPFLVAEAHWTFNPSLMRVADIPKIFPTSGEPWAIRKAHEGGWDRTIAQHVPGVFRHIGAGDSLADRTKGR